MSTSYAEFYDNEPRAVLELITLNCLGEHIIRIQTGGSYINLSRDEIERLETTLSKWLNEY